MLALQIATHGAVMPALQPALQLRGGMSLGGVDETQIATGLTALRGVQGLMMYQNPDKVGEMYDIPSTGVTDFFAENIGALFLGMAIAGYSVLNGGDAAEAAGYANIPGLLLSVKNLVDDTSGKLGWSDASKYAPLAVSGLLTAGLLGKLDFLSAADALKYSAYWLLANGAGMYFVPDKAMEGWGATYKGDAEFTMVKLMGQALAGFGVFLFKLEQGASATEAIGYSWALNTAANIDANYITKYSAFPEDKSRFWLAVGAVGAGALLL
jgi:hypothetical protein